jgi:hypothetical protein
MNKLVIFTLWLLSVRCFSAPNIEKIWTDAYRFNFSISSYSKEVRLLKMKEFLISYCDNDRCKEPAAHILSYLYFKRYLELRGFKLDKELLVLDKQIVDNKIDVCSSKECQSKVSTICNEKDKKSYLAYPFCISYIAIKYHYRLNVFN